MGSGASKEEQSISVPASASATSNLAAASGGGASVGSPSPASTRKTGAGAGGGGAAAAAGAGTEKRSKRASEQQQQQQQTAKPHSKAAQERVKKARELVGGEDSDEFHNACMVVFQNADMNKDGLLDRTEFWSVLHSKSLNLNLSAEEKDEFLRMAGLEKDGNVSYKEFVPVVKRLLQRVYQKKNVDWNDWCWFKSPQGKVLYMNKRTGHVQDVKPPNFRENRVEELVFQSIMRLDGTEITVCVDESGSHLYMDWETQTWKPLPAEWLAESQSEDVVEDHDARVGEYRHPTRGVFATYLYENSRNTRLYFDDSLGQWARMPLAWERNVEEVKVMLEELDRLFPDWKSVNEQLLVLRECNYDLSDAVMFADINCAANQKKRRETNLSVSGFARSKSTLQGRPDESEMGTGNLSVATSSYIHELETKLASAEQQIEGLRTALVEYTEEKTKTFQREQTRITTTVAKQDRDNSEAEKKISELNKVVGEQREAILALERELVAHKADRDRIVSMQKEIKAMESNSSTEALKAKSAEAEQLRVENVALKMKLQTMGQQIQFPMANPETAAIIKGLHAKVLAMQREQTTLAVDSQEHMLALREELRTAAKVSRSLAVSVRTQLDDITQKYRSEMLQRKLLYNKVQELRGNIRVFCRVRHDPRAKAEEDVVFEFPSNTEAMVTTLQGDRQLVDFDRVYGPASTQESVFEDTKPLILSCVDGYNVCIMAYGQTGSGKTFTMMGPSENMGVNRRAIRELLALVQRSTDVEYTVKVSLMEVYNEKIYDLLADTHGDGLEVHQSANGGVMVAKLIEEPVASAEDVESVLARGDAHRSVASTAMNSNSSRSHLLMQMSVSGFNKISKVVTMGKLTLVDLAGSERVAKSEASGQRLVEAAAINKSLSALGHVFKSLASNAPHIPYRNSKLTHVLQDSLGGDSKTCVFINCSPLASNLSETMCTINFGRNIRKIELGPATKHKMGARPPPSM